MTNGVVIYQDHLRMARAALTDAELGTLIGALFDHVNGEQINLDGKTKTWLACYEVMSEAADENVRRYIEKCDRNKENGKKGGRPKKPNGFSEEPNGLSENRTDIDENPIKEKRVKENKEEDKRGEEREFTPPTPAEVRAYCLQNGIQVDEYRFCDYNTARGWMIGNQPMKDWQAAVRTWVSREENF